MSGPGAIIILNWNRADETLACLRALAAQKLDDLNKDTVVPLRSAGVR
ncbi:MAG: hypothetical protein IAE81_20000 [Caldilineaceae bacterium]|jgi:GT2 family glycosyltransferase|nr:hypothetical protein [Caldilineaceae bacterium]